MAFRQLETSKGKPLQVVDGFTMCFHRKNASGTGYQWRCTKYWKGCPARGSSLSLNTALVMTSGADTATKHNHNPDPVSPEVSYLEVAHGNSSR